MGWFSKDKSKNKSSFSYDQGVIITLRLGESGFESQDSEFLAIQNLERSIGELLPPNSGVDGDDFGDGECIIYVYGPSADEIFHAIEGTLKQADFNFIEVMLQYGEPGEESSKTRCLTL